MTQVVPPSRRRGVVVGVAVAVALVLWTLASWVRPEHLQWVPLGWRVRSAGSQYPGLDEAASVILSGLAGVTGVAVVVEVATWHVGLRRALRRTDAGARAGVALGALTAAVYGFLARPHNAFPSNARVHWVDILFDRRDNFFYALVKVPHAVFYENPWALQALLGGLDAWLVFHVVRRATGRPWAGLAAGVSFLVSAQMLLFANSAEDVTLAVMALLLVVAATQARRGWWLGGALMLAMLARPPFLLMAPAVALGQYATLVGPPAARLRALARDPMLRQAAVVFVPAFVLWHGVLNVSGNGWLLTGGRIVDTPLVGLDPRPVDGFAISAFSGAFVGHLAWLVPVPVLVAVGVVIARWRSLEVDQRRVIVVVGAFVVGNLLLLEALPLFYFNIRYLTYLLPLFLVVAWMLPSAVDLRGASWRPGMALLLGVLTLSPTAAPHRELHIRDTVRAEPLVSLYPSRGQLRDLVGDEPVQTVLGRLQRRNVLAYVLKVPFESLHEVDPADGLRAGWLVTDRPDVLPDAAPVLESEGVRLLRVPQGGVGQP